MQSQLRRLDKLTALRSEATWLAGRDHESADCASLLRDAGGSVEMFLKSSAYAPDKKGSFERLIDDLPTIGAPEAGVAALHVLRKSYNAAKHDHRYAPTVHVVTGALEGAIRALTGWCGIGIGNTEKPAPVLYRRTLWIASWDHYIHGDGEVLVFLPMTEEDGEWPPAIDVVYLKGLAWPDVLAPLAAEISAASGTIPKKFLDAWESEGDYVGAHVFEGEYRKLLRTLVRAELRLDLIPCLKREADASAMRTAIAMATADVARTWTEKAATSELIAAIQGVAAVEYAAPRSAPLAKRFTESFGRLLFDLAPSELAEVTGPRFVTKRKFDELARSARSLVDGAQISGGYELVLAL